jgi:hypothetical protein
MVWLVIILVLSVVFSLIFALKFLVFKSRNSEALSDKCDNRVVNLLTLRVVLTVILLALSYLYLSSI